VRGIKLSALVLATSLTLTGALTIATAESAAGKSGPVTLHKGSDRITLTWVARANGAGFVGTIGNLSIDGASVQPDPHLGTFDVSGQLEGKTNFNVKLSVIGATATEIIFRATGKLGATQVRGKAALALPTSPTGNGSLSITGTLGGKAISGTIPLPADTTDHVAGKIKVG
jgi:hypothetical protein